MKIDVVRSFFITTMIFTILACSTLQVSATITPTVAVSITAPSHQAINTPIGPTAISISNFQNLSQLYQWSVGSDIVNLTGIALSPHADIVALLTVRYPEQYSLEIRNPQDGSLMWKADLGDKAAYPAIAFSPDGTLIAVGLDHGSVVIYNTADGSAAGTFKGHIYSVRKVKFSPNGKLLASGASDNTAQVWDVASGTNLGSYKVKTDVRDIAFSPDNKFLAVTTNYVNVYSVSGGSTPTVFYDTAGDTQDMGRVAFFPSGLFLAAEGNWLNPLNNRWRPRILIWDFPNNLTSPFNIPIQYSIDDLEISPDGQLLVGDYTGQGKLIFINLVNKQVINTIKLGPKLYMSYSGDFSKFAVISTKTSVTIWGLPTDQ